MTHIAPLLILTSSLLMAAEASILCAWTQVFPAEEEEEVHYSFVRSDPRRVPPSLRLYHSAWSGERALLSCAWSDDAAVIQNYLSLCRERTQAFTDHPDESYDVDIMFDAEDVCVSLRTVSSPRERSEVRSHQRVKRGIIVPGTLWCGSGNKAPSYEDLGVFAETDSCCREHDHCKHTILSFHSEFGVFNSHMFTMSHCDCDRKFRSCLMEANDSMSHVVGYTFFNLLKMHCFNFSHRLQCTQRNWFGMCKETKMALYAEVHSPAVYESDMNSTDSILNSTKPTDFLDPQPSSVTAAASTAPSASPAPASSTPVAKVTASTASNASGSVPASRHDPENTLPTKNRTVDTDLTGIQNVSSSAEEQLSCDVFRDLDECRSRILPQQRRYGLHNPEARTLYHCNCTSRLFQTLAKQRQVSKVQSLLLGRVSPSCFLPQDCRAGNTCTAVLVEAELPQLDHSSRAEVEEQRHLQAVTPKVRRPNTRRGRRKDFRLHKLCLRMVRPKRTKSRKQAARRLNVNITEGQYEIRYNNK